MHSRQIHTCVKCGMSNTTISEVIDTNLAKKRKYLWEAVPELSHLFVYNCCKKVSWSQAYLFIILQTPFTLRRTVCNFSKSKQFIYVWFCLYFCLNDCPFVCIYVCMSLSICLSVCFMSCCLYICMSVSLFMCMYACRHVNLSVGVYLCLPLYLSMCVCLYVSWYVCMYICSTFIYHKAYRNNYNYDDTNTNNNDGKFQTVIALVQLTAVVSRAKNGANQ